jgi:hypothetical protein
VGDTLYYLHGDPTHTLLAVSDAQGTSQGHLWYDPHGSVLSSTLPVTLTEQLLSSQGLDSRLGLVYHGDGRWYDAANRLISVNGQAYTWDNNGNLLNDGVRSYSYDHANRLTQVVSGTLTTGFTYPSTGSGQLTARATAWPRP